MTSPHSRIRPWWGDHSTSSLALRLPAHDQGTCSPEAFASPAWLARTTNKIKRNETERNSGGQTARAGGRQSTKPIRQQRHEIMEAGHESGRMLAERRQKAFKTSTANEDHIDGGCTHRRARSQSPRSTFGALLFGGKPSEWRDARVNKEQPATKTPKRARSRSGRVRELGINHPESHRKRCWLGARHRRAAWRTRSE